MEVYKPRFQMIEMLENLKFMVEIKWIYTVPINP